MSNSHKPPIWTRGFINIFLSNFFIFVAFYALLTTLPIFVIDHMHGTKTEAGLVTTVFLLSAIVVRPFSGKLLDDYGKKNVLLVSTGFFLLSTLMYMWIHQLPLLLALRFFHGIWFSIATTATAAIAADAIPLTRRGEGLGYYAMSMNIAVVTGPFLALTMMQFVSFTWLFLILSIVMIFSIVCTIFIQAPQTQHTPNRHKLTFDDLFERQALPISFIGSLVAFGYSSIISFISIYAKELNLLQAASFFFVIYAVAMIASRPFVGRLFDSKGPNQVIYPAFISFAIGLATLSFTNSALMLYISGALIGLGYGTIVPSFQTLAVQSAANGRNGHATATFFTFFDLGIAAGSYILGIVASFFGYKQLYFYTALFILLTFLIYKRTKGNTLKHELLPLPKKQKEVV